jgi:hypothetical protein
VAALQQIMSVVAMAMTGLRPPGLQALSRFAGDPRPFLVQM